MCARPSKLQAAGWKTPAPGIESAYNTDWGNVHCTFKAKSEQWTTRRSVRTIKRRTDSMRKGNSRFQPQKVFQCVSITQLCESGTHTYLHIWWKLQNTANILLLLAHLCNYYLNFSLTSSFYIAFLLNYWSLHLKSIEHHVYIQIFFLQSIAHAILYCYYKFYNHPANCFHMQYSYFSINRKLIWLHFLNNFPSWMSDSADYACFKESQLTLFSRPSARLNNAGRPWTWPQNHMARAESASPKCSLRSFASSGDSAQPHCGWAFFVCIHTIQKKQLQKINCAPNCSLTSGRRDERGKQYVFCEEQSPAPKYIWGNHPFIYQK